MILSNEELLLKAAGINFIVFNISDEITKKLQENVEDFSNLSQKEVNIIFFVVSYTILYQAQKFLLENFIQTEENASVLVSHQFNLFEKSSGINPKSHIQDIFEYIKQGDTSREIQYAGSKICKLLEKENAFLMLNITAVLAIFLEHGFKESIKSAWELPDEKLKEMLDRLETTE